MLKITNSEIKEANKSNIYRTIYNMRETSKQQLADSLGLSMPTVTHNLKEFEELGLIKKEGFYSSSASGGRKARIISCNRTARVAIGVEILLKKIRIAAVDLYGEVLKRDELKIPFETTTLYYCALGNWINSFILELSFPAEQILGVGIAVQGLVSADHKKIVYGEILHCTGLELKEFASYIKYPSEFIHDTEAAAFAELWKGDEIQDMLYLLINRTMGGALIVSGKTHSENGHFSGSVEHMCLYPDGKPCYCGQKGCVESYCSLNALLEEAGMDDDSFFFEKLRNGDKRLEEIWRQYLKHLALAINNSIRVFDCDIVLSGEISVFLTDEDMELLCGFVKERNSFPFYSRNIRPGVRGKDIAAVGAALHLVRDFLDHLFSV